MEFKNDMEKYVARLAVAHYREKLHEIERDKELLSAKKFKYGDYVVKKGTSHFDDVFGSLDGTVGKVICFDRYNNYYRVRYNAHVSYVGTREEEIELYQGEVPQDLIDYNIDDVVWLQFGVVKP